MNLVPGVLVDREDVGGAESGQQSAYYGHGGTGDDSTWTVDGANITDPSAIGAAPAYLNMNAYEELQVTIGSTDISAQTGGVQLNFVSKRAGNRFSGDFHLYVEDEKWEMSQTPPQYFLDQGWGAPGIFRLYQYGVNFGGPIIKDKWWFYGSYGIQDIHAKTPVGDEDATWLISGYFKTNFQLGNTSGELHYSHDAKKKWGRTVLSRAQQDAGTLFDQDGPGNMYMAQLQHVMGNLMLNAKVNYMDGGFILDPRGADVDPATDINTGADWMYYISPSYWGGSAYQYDTNRNTLNLALDGNYFAEGVLGGDHEIRFGVDYYTGDTTTTYRFPNQRYAYILSGGRFAGTPAFGLYLMFPNFLRDGTFERISFYLSDTATFGKLTASLGVRYDKEMGTINEVNHEGITWIEPGGAMNGMSVFTSSLTNYTTVGGKSPQSYEVISPRLSLSYDITGDGKNVIKLTAARYGSQSGNDLIFRFFKFRYAYGLWYDYNQDEFINWTELITPILVTNGLDIDADGRSLVTTADGFNSPLLDEVSLTFEKALGEDIAVSVSGFYKKRHKQVDVVGEYTDGTLEYDGHWTQSGTYTFSNGTTIPIWNRDARPPITHYRNYSDSYARYMAVVLQFSKKFAKKWMLDVSFTYSDWKDIWAQSEFANGDLTTYNYFNEGVVAPESGGSGLSGVFVNSRWQFKLSGLYQLPYGINLTAVFQAREGYVIPYHESFYSGIGGVGTRDVYLPDTKFGDDRLPSFWMLSMGLEKTFKISDTASATVFVDAYNLTNNSTTLLVETSYTAPNFDQPLRVLNPGIFQFGIRVSF
jgi:hypothetical protein